MFNLDLKGIIEQPIANEIAKIGQGAKALKDSSPFSPIEQGIGGVIGDIETEINKISNLGKKGMNKYR